MLTRLDNWIKAIPSTLAGSLFPGLMRNSREGWKLVANFGGKLIEMERERDEWRREAQRWRALADAKRVRAAVDVQIANVEAKLEQAREVSEIDAEGNVVRKATAVDGDFVPEHRPDTISDSERVAVKEAIASSRQGPTQVAEPYPCDRCEEPRVCPSHGCKVYTAEERAAQPSPGSMKMPCASCGMDDVGNGHQCIENFEISSERMDEDVTSDVTGIDKRSMERMRRRSPQRRPPPGTPTISPGGSLKLPGVHPLRWLRALWRWLRALRRAASDFDAAAIHLRAAERADAKRLVPSPSRPAYTTRGRCITCWAKEGMFHRTGCMFVGELIGKMGEPCKLCGYRHESGADAVPPNHVRETFRPAAEAAGPGPWLDIRGSMCADCNREVGRDHAPLCRWQKYQVTYDPPPGWR